MATQIARKASWLALFLNAATVRAAFWTATTRYQYSLTTSYYTYVDGDVDTDTYTRTRTIKSGVTPTGAPVSTSTDPYYSDETLLLIEAYYSSGAVADSDLEPTSYDYTIDSSYTQFRMTVTETAPASCPTQYVITTDVSVSVPSIVADQLTPISKETDTNTNFGYWETWYLSDGAAPFTSTTEYYYEYYLASCTTPYSYATSTGLRSGGGSSSSDDDDTDLTMCSWYGACTSVKTWVIVIASIIPSLFVLGFLESWLWFRRLMLGKGALRFGTICWIMISLWVACFTRSQSARSPEDQKLLREKWNQMGSWEAFKMWWKWGFRHAYPVPLLGQYSRNTVGIVPAGQQVVPQMQQQNMYPGGPPPPGAAYPSGVPQGQAYYFPPPQGWSPVPNGQGYPMPPPGQVYMPPPGQAYMPPPNGMPVYYGDQSKEAPSVTEASVSPIQPPAQPIPTPPQPIPSPPTNVSEVSATPQPMAPPPAGVVEAPAPPQPAPSPLTNVSEVSATPQPYPQQPYNPPGSPDPQPPRQS
ncbi:hypothetical protein BU26DRAFT_289322 [Trematosphaeria pertusa]|uniref:Uncharacterized protein n=1 Tax=Trematosphaeria pertusa TaxID=390896 RepID=A0A6A6IH67_9PLEO|nr:uncharacterized protein BU26DRAFT_289322 [Trematosphaeria pertusa]KAF2249771.1 hypothetical protein BU26DRAFT_289322 [Trematosphaeria pertusa]